MEKIKFPNVKTIFKTDLTVRIYDLNYGNHLGNDSLVSLLHEARVRFFKSHGFTELDIDGVGILITNLVINYKAEAFYGDEITVEIGLDDLSKIGVDFMYTIKLKNINTEIAKAITTATFFDYKKSKVVKIPMIFLDLIKSLI